MPLKATISRTQFSNHKSQVWLLGVLVFLVLLPLPATFFPNQFRLILSVAYSLLVAIGIKSVTENNRDLSIGIALGAVSFLLIWWHFFNIETPTIAWVKTLSLTAFFAYMTILLFGKIAEKKTVDLLVIFESISGYLLLGIVGGLVFNGLELALPNSFNAIGTTHRIYDLQYFSFITLSSVGFGDITPKTEAARALTLLVGIAGQLYLAIIIAILVGKYLSQKENSN